MKILVVGGAGYIGSIVSEHILARNHEVVVFDNLSIGHRQAVPDSAPFIKGDMGNEGDLESLFAAHKFDAVMHFAAMSTVSESVEKPDAYRTNNVIGSMKLLKACRAAKIGKFIFSSSAAVYGEPTESPITEAFRLKPCNPYGQNKLEFERELKKLAEDGSFDYASLRYFNAAGASAERGEDHRPETHVIPLVLQTASGQRESFTVFGDDYPTRDGTCIRDYVHVLDLAEAHLLALEYICQESTSATFNLGTEHGASVNEIISATEKVTGKKLTVTSGPRRLGDPPQLVSSSEAIKRQLGWQPQRADIASIIEDAWRWHLAHPSGYGQ